MENDVQVLKISGAGSANGGKYDEVRISGAGEVKGDIECRLFKTSGASEVKGNVKAQSFEISGASEIKGSVDAEYMKISGASEINGDVTTKDIRVSGSSEIKGALRAETVTLKGACEIEKDCEAEDFKAYGGFEIKGLLNAGNIEIKIWGGCSVKEIGGEKIDIRIGNEGVFGFTKMISMFFSKPKGLETDLIEGDEIYLEETKAKVVRGNNIVIGEGCEIELVEYMGDLRVIANGRVNEQRKI